MQGPAFGAQTASAFGSTFGQSSAAIGGMLHALQRRQDSPSACDQTHNVSHMVNHQLLASLTFVLSFFVLYM